MFLINFFFILYINLFTQILAYTDYEYEMYMIIIVLYWGDFIPVLCEPYIRTIFGPCCVSWQVYISTHLGSFHLNHVAANVFYQLLVMIFM